MGVELLILFLMLIELPNYSNIVRYHIDVFIIESKLEQSRYYCVQDFVTDVELMWSNAINYFSLNKEQLGIIFCELS